MPVGERYAIQRADLLWYGGQSDKGEAQWFPNIREALKVKNLDEAKAMVAALQQEGHRVFLMGL